MIGQKDDAARRKAGESYLTLLRRDKVATVSASALFMLILAALLLPIPLGDLAVKQQLSLSNLPPLSTDEGWQYLLGSDPLGRSLLARLIIAARTTLLIAIPSVSLAAIVGTVVGTVAGHAGGWLEAVVMRLADVVLSFPSLLLALIILYLLGSEPYVIVLVLSVTRLPVYTRTARAQAREVERRPYVDAARVLGLRGRQIVVRHSLPAVLPTVMTLATLEFGLVMLIESSLTFLGIGVQPPSVSWGLMVADGRGYLETAWWLTFFPGLAISMTVLATNMVSNWARLATDPKQRWRFDTGTNMAAPARDDSTGGATVGRTDPTPYSPAERDS